MQAEDDGVTYLKYTWSQINNGSICDFSTLQWCESDTHNKLHEIDSTLL